MLSFENISANFTDLVWVDLFNESLKGRHPAGGQVTILEENPLASLHGTSHHSLSTRTLRSEVVSINIDAFVHKKAF